MTLHIEPITTAALSAALDAASRQHALTATNIANAASGGYAPARLSFAEQLGAAQAVLRENGRLDASAVDALRSMREATPEIDEEAGTVRLDVEMAELARNAVHFQTLAQGLARHLSLLAMAAADGRK
jgi:flagellar basal-body rod protein FlgB